MRRRMMNAAMVTKPGEDVADVSVKRRAVRSFCASETFSLNLFSDSGRAGCNGTNACPSGENACGAGDTCPNSFYCANNCCIPIIQ